MVVIILCSQKFKINQKGEATCDREKGHKGMHMATASFTVSVYEDGTFERAMV